jgi:MraZ protein
VEPCGKKWGNVSDQVFQGTSALTLDGKGRMAVPARHREALAASPDRTLTFTKSPVGCLLVFQASAWDDFRRLLLSLPMQADGWRRLFLGSAVAVEIDSADRVLVPAELRSWAGLDKDVLLMGMGRRLELWDAQRHARHEAEVLATPMPEVVQSFVF